MKAEQLHESVRPATVIVVGLTLAIIFGTMVGKGEPKLVFAFFAAVAILLTVLLVRERIWMIIPLTATLNGKILVLPLPFSVAQIGVLVAFGMYLVFKAVKIVRLKPKIGTVEIWMSVMVLYMVVAFVRNPTGMEALGSDRVGGRPYFDLVVACAAFWVLSRSIATSRDALIIPLLGIAGNAFNTLINALAFRFPSLAGPISEIYSDIATENSDAGLAGPPDENGRIGYLQGLGGSMAAYACSVWRPFTLLNPLHIGRFLMFIVGVGAILFSGFRSSLFGIIQLFLLASYFRRGWPEVARAGLIAVVTLGAISLAQGNLIDLPFAAQRTLSFLPGKWDYAAKSEAEGSTEWRVTMWKAMMEGDKYIENKWLGDGYGFTKHQLEIMEANTLAGSTADQQENLLISGGVHSGPITAIRYAGYVGLVIFMILMVLVAIWSVRLIRRAEGTPFHTLALFFGMFNILRPLNYVFIFGAFESDLPVVICSIGFLRMLENSLEVYGKSQNKILSKEVIQPPKPRPSPQFVPLGRTS